jgi:hypothetical protein
MPSAPRLLTISSALAMAPTLFIYSLFFNFYLLLDDLWGENGRELMKRRPSSNSNEKEKNPK